MIKDYPNLEGMVVVGEIGGDAEETLAEHVIKSNFKCVTFTIITWRWQMHGQFLRTHRKSNQAHH